MSHEATEMSFHGDPPSSVSGTNILAQVLALPVCQYARCKDARILLLGCFSMERGDEEQKRLFSALTVNSAVKSH
jgi:hypothetical protein